MTCDITPCNGVKVTLPSTQVAFVVPAIKMNLLEISPWSSVYSLCLCQNTKTPLEAEIKNCYNFTLQLKQYWKRAMKQLSDLATKGSWTSFSKKFKKIVKDWIELERVGPSVFQLDILRCFSKNTSLSCSYCKDRVGTNRESHHLTPG